MARSSRDSKKNFTISRDERNKQREIEKKKKIETNKRCVAMGWESEIINYRTHTRLKVFDFRWRVDDRRARLTCLYVLLESIW